MKNRGMMLESIINKTNKTYEMNDIALIHKKDVSIKFSKVKNDNGKLRVENAYIHRKSYSDYYGIYKGTFIAFEAKSTNLKSLPLENIKKHQHNYLKKIIRNGGFAFYIIYFKTENKFFMVKWKTIDSIKGKSLSYKHAIQNSVELDLIYPGILDYIAEIKKA